MSRQFLRRNITRRPIQGRRANHKLILKIRCMQQWKCKVQSDIRCKQLCYQRAVLKLFTDEELQMEHGNWFHAAGPATTNAHSPNFVLVCSTTRPLWADDRVRPSTQDCSLSSDKYTGADPCIILYIIRHSLNPMRCDTGSQCNRSQTSQRHASIIQLHKVSSPQHSSCAADDQEHIEVHQRGGCCSSQSCWLQSSWLRIWPCRTEAP